MKMQPGTQPVELTVDLDSMDLKRHSSGLALVRVDFIKGGKRVTAWLEVGRKLHHHHHTLRMTVVNRVTDNQQTAAIRPWTVDEPEDA